MTDDERLRRYIRKKYYKADQKVITIHVKRESDLYNPLDKMRDTLSDDVMNFLERSAETLLPFNKIQIRIKGPLILDRDNFRKCLKVHYGIENLNCERIEKIVRKKKIFLLIVAFLTLATYAFMGDKFSEIRSFVLTLAVWEYVDMLIYKDEDEEIRRYICEMLENAEVID